MMFTLVHQEIAQAEQLLSLPEIVQEAQILTADQVETQIIPPELILNQAEAQVTVVLIPDHIHNQAETQVVHRAPLNLQEVQTAVVAVVAIRVVTHNPAEIVVQYQILSLAEVQVARQKITVNPAEALLAHQNLVEVPQALRHHQAEVVRIMVADVQEEEDKII